MKKALAVLLAAVMVMTFLPMLATAKYIGEPTCLYVGEEEKSGHNLIEMYEETHDVRVVSVYDSRNYYEVTYEKGVGYILTFYREYKNSDLVRVNKISAVVYCDGDLTIRVQGNTTLDANGVFPNTKADSANAYGIYVEGTLNIEGVYDAALGHHPGALTVNGTLAQTNGSKTLGHVGIYGNSVLVYEDTIIANGGRAAIQTEDVFGMIRANIYANRDARLCVGSARLFDYSIITPHYVQSEGMTSAAGKVNIETFHAPSKTEDIAWPGNNFEEKIVVYDRAYKFDQEQYVGNWLTRWKMFYNPSIIPDCMYITFSHGGSYCMKNSVSSNSVVAQAPGSGVLAIYLVCGTRGSACLSSSYTQCNLQWWQAPFYFLSGTWLRVWLANRLHIVIGLE